jgi:ribosomal RNA assembly protein
MIDFVAIPRERMKFLEKKHVEGLEKLAEVKIKQNEDISIESEDSIKIMRVKLVLKAFGRGFDFDDALNLLDEDYVLESIELREYGKSRERILTLKGRVIGTNGKMKKMVEECAEVKVAIYGKTISIIGRWDKIMVAKQAIEMILTGSLHETVCRFLEKKRV